MADTNQGVTAATPEAAARCAADRGPRATAACLGWLVPMMAAKAGRFLAVTLLAVALILVIPPSRSAVAVTTSADAQGTVSPEDLCSAQLDAAEQLATEIAAHNAEPHIFTLPQQAAAYDAYNAEADSLNSRKAMIEGQLEDCLAAMGELENSGGGNSGLRAPSSRKLAQITNAVKQIPNGWKPPAAAPRRGWQIPPGSTLRPLYDALRAGNPGNLGDVSLQRIPRPPPNSPDPAFLPSLGRTIGTNTAGGSAVSPDHIVPLTELIQMPGFLSLTPQNMYVVASAPLNLQWLSYGANLSKLSRSAAFISGTSPGWLASQAILELQTRTSLQDIINTLLSAQSGG